MTNNINNLFASMYVPNNSGAGEESCDTYTLEEEDAMEVDEDVIIYRALEWCPIDDVERERTEERVQFGRAYDAFHARNFVPPTPHWSRDVAALSLLPRNSVAENNSADVAYSSVWHQHAEEMGIDPLLPTAPTLVAIHDKTHCTRRRSLEQPPMHHGQSLVVKPCQYCIESINSSH